MGLERELRAEFADELNAITDKYPQAEIEIVHNGAGLYLIVIEGVGNRTYGIGNWSDDVLRSDELTMQHNPHADHGWFASAYMGDPLDVEPSEFTTIPRHSALSALDDVISIIQRYQSAN